MRRRIPWTIAAVMAVVVLCIGARIALELRDDGQQHHQTRAAAVDDAPSTVERGRYLARVGNCAGCHTARGGAPYAGGVGIETPFGTVYAGNLTSSKTHGIGDWSPEDFWRAMHDGRSRDGRLLYPAFPYTSFTHTTREDVDAIFAFLRTVPAAEVPQRAHALRFPYDTQLALAAWRVLAFRPVRIEPEAAQVADWQRGAYLVNGLGHCIACHGARNALGATQVAAGLAGANLAVDGWLAPSLAAASEAGVADWPRQEIVQLLKTGKSARASVMGPMADVVYDSTQHLHDADLEAIAAYLQRLPAKAAAPAPAARPAVRDAGTMERGARIYDQRCAYCHGDKGQGSEGAWPPLAGNRAVTLANPVNLVQAVRHGGYLPATEGNPRPFGMPPFEAVLDDGEIAAVLSFVRASWGNDASPVSVGEVMRR